jgi:hypothetical protein
LSGEDKRILHRRFDANAYELNIDGFAVDWSLIEAIEVVKAARQSSPAGWLVKNLMYLGDRYHIGVYWGKQEMVLSNISLEAARYVAGVIAHYAPGPVTYSGEPDIVTLTDE